MKALQNISIAAVAVLILAGMYTDGWLSVALSSAAAVIAILVLAFAGNSNKK
ncbi:MAG: hypothetical protein IJX27_05205 [Clostridia bacterium]|nr:hypothetical protein [Clostridia bacterium]